MPIEGTPSIVTGGAAGIGLGIVEGLARKGAKVAIFDVDAAGIDAAVERLGGEGATVSGHVVDVSDRSQVEAAHEKVRAEFGPVLILVNNAGIEQFGKFSKLEPDEWERVMAINLRGPYNCVQTVLKDMQAAGWGRIVNITSSSAQSGQPLMSAYVTSKAGLTGLTKCLAHELGPRGITVNAVPPGLIDTPMSRRSESLGRLGEGIDYFASITPVRRAGTPADMANAVLFLCTDEASYITGQVIGVNGGRTT
jgi:NAD(P)-dependent dehydrogenase (short-subunit alcohol dehydrogenase family)